MKSLMEQTFNAYVTCDDGLSSCVTEVSEIVYLAEPAIRDSDVAINDETPIESVF